MDHHKKTETHPAPKVEKKTEKKDSAGVTLKINKDSLTVGILVVLVLISGVQTLNLSKLKTGTASAATTSSSAPSSTTTSTSGDSAELPSSLQNLPSQVGGC